ncbi:MAG: asparagine synthetase B [Planctomycetota bacterium]
MCGIAGILRTWSPGDSGGGPPPHLESIPESWLDVLDESIKHRGPDGAGRFRDRSVRADRTVVDVAFVHRRLSIIDHAGGHQPMVHDGERLRPDLTYGPGETPIVASELEPDRRVVAVVFNGCIYNHRELRAELEAEGHRFETDHSDTEVLVHGWREWGWDLQEWIENESTAAASIWDRDSSTLIGATDFFGERPLWYGSDGISLGDRTYDESTPIFFSSVLTGIVPLLSRPIPSRRSIPKWLGFGHHPTLGPIDQSCHSARRLFSAIYSDADPNEHDREAARREATARDAIDRRFGKSLAEPEQRRLLAWSTKALADDRVGPIDTLIRECVIDRLDADRPIAALLSGGIDSSIVCAHAHRLTGSLKTVCVRMSDPRFDESDAARQVAEHLGTDHATIDCEPSAAGDLVHLIEQTGIPLGDSSLLPTYWACRAASTIAPVLLTGDGGDELFVGYQRYFAFSGKWEILTSIVPVLGLFEPLLPERNPRSWSTLAARLLRAYRRMSYNSLLAIFEAPDASRLLAAKAELPDAFTQEEKPWVARHADFDFTLPGDYLRKVDSASMSVPVETRAPFLDRRLLLATQQLKRLLVAHGRKGLLKQVARRYLPDRIVDRPKRGFAIPISEWFRTDYGGMRQLLYDHLESAEPFPGLAEAGVELNMAFVRTMLREHDKAGEASLNPWHGRDHGQRLYMLLVLSIWCRWLEGVRRNGTGGLGLGTEEKR